MPPELAVTMEAPAFSGNENSLENESTVLTEWQLIQRAQALEEEALSSLYSTYYPKIYNYGLLHLGNIQAAEDLASEVILKVLQSLNRYQFTGTPFSAWVFRIARNKVIDLRRRNKRWREVGLTESLAASQTSPETLAELALDRKHLERALQHLTEEQRQVIILKFIEGFNNTSVSHILRRSEGAVRLLQHRALKSLRRIMMKEPNQSPKPIAVLSGLDGS